jgi:hypothetical protein
MVVFSWHGYRGYLNRRGAASPPPAGAESMCRAGVTHTCVPMDHPGQNGDYNYIEQIQNDGISVIRSLELRWNAGVPQGHDKQIDLGKIILEWNGIGYPGPYFEQFSKTLQLPCEGIAWNLEHPVLDTNMYPLTEADETLARMLGVHPKYDYVDFRCWQFALLFKMYKAVAQEKVGHKIIAVGYSGYEGVEYRTTSLDAAYGCNWSLQEKPLYWAGKMLEGIDYAVCAYPTENLPKEALKPKHTLPILHNIGLVEMTSDAKRNVMHGKAVMDRMAKMGPRDGLATVAVNHGPWSKDDDMVHEHIRFYQTPVGNREIQRYVKGLNVKPWVKIFRKIIQTIRKIF